ncbi:hypothetical protein RhiirA5_446689 [Rhizophagus irregularis]|uniref:Uncharacterized protein n=1 Tax=Rhizophagus irregularis TaxID=588596 RepID=A0A2N0NBK8_9GLOM|nr:hypothetical protein RhiirA5_446689 [Rhizophagus irregularis]
MKENGNNVKSAERGVTEAKPAFCRIRESIGETMRLMVDSANNREEAERQNQTPKKRKDLDKAKAFKVRV